MKIRLFENDFEVPDFNPPRLAPRQIVIILSAILAITLLLGTVYQIEAEEAGVVLRVGQYVRTTDAGLRFKLPFIEQVMKVPVEHQLKQEFGFRTEEAAHNRRGPVSVFGQSAVGVPPSLPAR